MFILLGTYCNLIGFGGCKSFFKALLIYVSAQKVSEKRENMKSLVGDGDTVNPLKPLQVIHYPAFFPSLLSFILQKLGMMMA